jgi:Tfp pilus assembly protein PilN
MNMKSRLSIIKYFLQNLFRIKHHIFIHLTESYLYIAHVRTNTNYYRPLQSSIHEFKHTEISNNRLFNLTALHTHVCNFIQAHHLNAPQLIIGTPLASEQTPLTTLQLALCFSKGSLHIEKIIHIANTTAFPQHLTSLPITPKAPNLLDGFLPPHYTSVHRSVSLAITCLLFAAIGLTAFHRTTQSSSQNITMHLQANKQTLQTLQRKAASLQDVEKKNKILQDKITLLNGITLNANNPCTICATIAKKMPKQSYLTFLEIGSSDITDKKESQQKGLPLTMRGSTHNPSEINDFVKHLNESFDNAQFSLARIRKAQKSKAVKAKSHEPPKYSFTISGIISS